MAALAAIPAAMSTISTVATIAGTAVAAAGTIAAGRQERALADAKAQMAVAQGKAKQQEQEFLARQYEARGKEEQAASQAEAAQLQRQKKLALSKLTANAAASGFTATDPTTLTIGDEIAKYGTLQEQMAQFGGASRRAGLESQATASRMTGQSAYDAGMQEAYISRMAGKAERKASYFKAGSTILEGISTLAERYNPTTTAPAPTRQPTKRFYYG